MDLRQEAVLFLGGSTGVGGPCASPSGAEQQLEAQWEQQEGANQQQREQQQGANQQQLEAHEQAQQRMPEGDLPPDGLLQLARMHRSGSWERQLCLLRSLRRLIPSASTGAPSAYWGRAGFAAGSRHIQPALVRHALLAVLYGPRLAPLKRRGVSVLGGRQRGAGGRRHRHEAAGQLGARAARPSRHWQAACQCGSKRPTGPCRRGREARPRCPSRSPSLSGWCLSWPRCLTARQPRCACKASRPMLR